MESAGINKERVKKTEQLHNVKRGEQKGTVDEEAERFFTFARNLWVCVWAGFVLLKTISYIPDQQSMIWQNFGLFSSCKLQRSWTKRCLAESSNLSPVARGLFFSSLRSPRWRSSGGNLQKALRSRCRPPDEFVKSSGGGSSALSAVLTLPTSSPLSSIEIDRVANFTCFLFLWWDEISDCVLFTCKRPSRLSQGTAEHMPARDRRGAANGLEPGRTVDLDFPIVTSESDTPSNDYWASNQRGKLGISKNWTLGVVIDMKFPSVSPFSRYRCWLSPTLLHFLALRTCFGSRDLEREWDNSSRKSKGTGYFFIDWACAHIALSRERERGGGGARDALHLQIQQLSWDKGGICVSQAAIRVENSKGNCSLDCVKELGHLHVWEVTFSEATTDVGVHSATFPGPAHTHHISMQTTHILHLKNR